MQTKCSNCEATITEKQLPESMCLTHRGDFVAALCKDCLTNVKVGKLVFKKNGENYDYEQYLPVECG